MDGIGIALLAVSGLAILLLPKRWALAALLVGTCYVTRAQAIELGPFHFTVVRILIGIGVLRVLLRTEWIKEGLHALDWLIVSCGALMLISVAFHKDPSNQIIERLGLVIDAWGAYFLTRSFCRTWEEACGLCRLLGIILVPIAAEMLVEKATAHDFFAFLGGVPEIPTIREGHVRAQGPFGHAILAGTIGAVCLPLVLSVWKLRRSAAMIGVVACLGMVYASTSSGPILSAGAAVVALVLWPYRNSMRFIRWSAVIAYVALDIIMKDPAYFILARIDLTGGSTGWFRARLIQSSVEHLSEWWLVGTDYTRHWMPSGVSWSPNHTDITNHYVQMGVLGGLPLMAMFIALVATGFAVIGRRLRESPKEAQFAVWGLGASLFSHAVTCISVSYFDQSVVFLYLTLGLIGSGRGGTVLTAERAEGSMQTASVKESNQRDMHEQAARLISHRVLPRNPAGHEPARSESQPTKRSPERAVRPNPPIEVPVGRYKDHGR